MIRADAVRTASGKSARRPSADSMETAERETRAHNPCRLICRCSLPSAASGGAAAIHRDDLPGYKGSGREYSRKSMQPTTSAGTPSRPSGVRRTICSRCCADNPCDISVSRYPGAIALTNTPRGPSSRASASVSLIARPWWRHRLSARRIRSPRLLTRCSRCVPCRAAASAARILWPG